MPSTERKKRKLRRIKYQEKLRVSKEAKTQESKPSETDRFVLDDLDIKHAEALNEKRAANRAYAKKAYRKNPDRKKNTSKHAYSADPEKWKAYSREAYDGNPEPKKAASKQAYSADPEKWKAYSREAYDANPEPKKVASKQAYSADPEKWKAYSRKAYDANPEPKKAASKQAYSADPEKWKAYSREAYDANPEPKKGASKQAYSADAEKWKGYSKKAYDANPEPKKATSKHAYRADLEKWKAYSRKSYHANPEKAKAHTKRFYSVNAQAVLRKMRKYYHGRQGENRAYRRARYALRPPKPDRKLAFVREIQNNLLKSKVARNKLLKAFKARYASFAKRRAKVTRQVACGSASRQLLSKVLQLRQNKAGLFLQCIKSVKKNIRSFESEEDFGERFHTRSSEPFFYESAYCHLKCDKVFPVNKQGQLVIADYVEDRKKPPSQQKRSHGNSRNGENGPSAKDALTSSAQGPRCTAAGSVHDAKDTMMPLETKRFKCTFLCRPLTQSEVDAIVTLRQAFDRPVEELREVLHTCDEGCPNPHYQTFYVYEEKDPNDPNITYTHYLPRDLKGHSLLCSLKGNCHSKLRIIRAASTHYETLRRFMRELYPALEYHNSVHRIDAALRAGDFRVLMKMAGCKRFRDIFVDTLQSDDSDTGAPSDVVPSDEFGLRRPNLESLLHVKYATVIHDLQKEIDDYPVYACCSCERLHQRKSVSKVRLGDKLGSDVWTRLQSFILEHSPDVRDDVLYMCYYCKPMIKRDKMPGRCVLNGLQTVPVPPELDGLDSLSSQLIQRAKCFQTVVRLGTYTSSKVPVYSSLKACKGTMFFLPLPLSKTECTLDLAKGLTVSGTPAQLPDPELYIIVNGTPTKGKVVWRSLVDVSRVKQALLKLKEINWLYRDVHDDSVDEAAKKVIEVVNSTSSIMLEKATAEEIDAFQAYTIRNLDKKLSTQPDIEQYKVLNVKEDPLNNRQKYLDVLCFPVLFPTGKFGEHHSREVKILPSEYAKARLLNKDSRFRKNPQYVFYLLWQKELRELSAGIYNMLKSARSSQPVSAAQLLNQVATSDEQLEGNLSTVLRSVRGTKQFWFVKRSELRCMIREYGTPTLFLTFSCAEYESADITDYLRRVNNVPSTYNIGKLCAEDPLSVSRKFSLKFHAFFNTVVCKSGVLGEVEHFYWKKEYQARGAPHYHALLWIRDAPVIGQDDSQRILAWIQARITCHIPDKKTCPELHRLVTRFQMHKCSAYCKRKRKVGGVFVTQCKFAFPRQVCESASLNDVESTLKSRKRIYQLARKENETSVNDYNPLLLLLWQANMDIQFVSESSLALAHYVSGYVTKAERSNMQEMWQEVGENKTVYTRLWNFGIRCLRSRECGLYEASDLLLGDHLYHKSVTVQWVDVSMPHRRNRRLRDYAQIKEMAKCKPDSKDIFEEGLLDSHYPNRPKNLDSVCLFDFVANYDWCGRDNEGNRAYRKLTKPRLPNHALFDPQKENERENYYYSLLLLFVPFRDESTLLLADETAEEAFNRLVPSSLDCSNHHAKLQTMLQAQSSVKQINDARRGAEDKEKKTADGKERDEQDGDDNDDIQLIGEAKTAMQEVLDMNVNVHADCPPLTLEERVDMLNVDQRRVFDKVKSHLLHQHRHESGQCDCGAVKPLHMFVSGVGGTGKSFLVEAVRALVSSIWSSHEFTCAVVAPTGLAAFNIGGVTVHRLFHLPVEHEGKTAGYWPLPEDARKVMKTTLRHVKVVVIDEISMVSSLTLAYIHLRLEEIFGGDEWFGCTNMLFVGDILQLPPVNGQPVFEQISAKSLTQKLGCTTSVNIWHDTVVYDELTLNERQRKDGEFSELLNSVRCGLPTEEALCALRERVMRVSIVDKFTQLQQQGLSPICLFPTRKACDELNSSMLSRLTSPTLDIACVDEVDETVSSHKWSKKAAEQLKKLNKDCNMTAGLEASLRLAVGARVMLRRNIDTKVGLVNGAIGTVCAISTSRVTVQFDHVSEPYKVEKVKSRFMVMRNYYVYRRQFPLILAYAVTIHKCQGLSLDCAIVDLSQQVFSVGMAYVALSRVRTLEGLHLVAFDAKSIMVSSTSLKEVNRLRKAYRSDLPLYVVPSSAKSRDKRKLSAAALGEHHDMPPPPQPPPLNEGHAGSQRAPQTVQSRRKRKMSEPAENAPSAKKPPPASGELKACTSSSSSNALKLQTHVDGTQVEQGLDDHDVSPYHFHPVDQEWQVNACSTLGIRFIRSNRVRPGGPRVPLKAPEPRTVRRITGDGNCLFRSLAYVVTGSEDQHMEIRQIIVRHMSSIAHLLLGTHIPNSYNSVEDYIRDTKMDQDSTWGTDVEMFTLAHLLKTAIFSYNMEDKRWWRFSPGFLDRTVEKDSTARAMYIRHPPGHFDVVRSIVKN